MINITPETGSTSADIIAALVDGGGTGWAEGAWLVADRQRAGHGRLGRVWHDGAGNFMGSTVVHLQPGDPAPSTLALVAGLAVLDAVAARLPPPARAELKWPNDVTVAGAKLAGILLERVGRTVVIGVGVNLAVAPEVPGRMTAALSRFGPAPDRDHFAADLMESLAREVDRWRVYGRASLIHRWEAAAHPLGTMLRVTTPGGADAGVISGRFAGLTEDGALRLGVADGTTRILYAGEVDFSDGVCFG